MVKSPSHKIKAMLQDRVSEVKKKKVTCKVNCKFAFLYAIIFICELVVDELLVIIVPAVELSDLLTNLLRRMLSVELSHSLEVYL
mgnify:CR=1 FL=1